MLKNLLRNEYGINDDLFRLSQEIEDQIKEKFKEIDNIKEYNQLKVLSAMQKMGLSDRHLLGTTGYGYNDIGREIIEEIYSEVFKTEDALVRNQIVSGTHALAICLFGILRPGDTMLSCAGKPYDTLESVIGTKPTPGSLLEFGVKYEQVDLLPNDEPDLEKIFEAVNENTKLALIQRSRGYSYRKALSIESIRDIIKTVKSKNKNTICMVDNCYGEFVCCKEPSEVGADIIAGSLIKNPGGGLALNGGGYVAGKESIVKLCANRLTAPGLGKRVGASIGAIRHIIQGFFLAPHVVSECLKGAVFM
ncbi:MAG TPA: methionine gamma-lyase family protein, partial [Clostridia bacterium]|nr:methionine gamma-lyase family protein [Clostridia bacterium]